MRAKPKAMPRDDLDERFRNLTDKQQAIVLVRVEHPDVPKTHISRDYAPEIYNERFVDSEDDTIDEMNNSYVTQVLNDESKQEIIKHKQEIKENERQEGELTTTGNPFTAGPDDQPQGFQSIQDRPVKQTGSGERDTTDSQTNTQQAEQTQMQSPAGVRVGQADQGVWVLFDERYLQQLLENQDIELPQELHERLVQALLDKAFA